MQKVVVYMSSGLYSVLKDYNYEMETEINDFIIDAIVEKLNNENEIFDADINENGFIIDDND